MTGRLISLLGAFLALSFTPLFADAPPVDPALTVVMSDIHQGPTLPKGRKPISGEALQKEARLQQACEKIAAMNPRPGRVLILGDIAYLDGALADYEVAKKSLALLDAAKIPWTAALGNHDRLENFLTVFPEKRLENPLMPGRLTSLVETSDADFILLDTHQESDTPIEKENPGGGLLDEKQRAWLDEKIAAYNTSEKPFYVASHHPPFEKEVAVSDALAGAKSFRGYLFGHWHRWQRATEANNVTSFTMPAVGYQFGEQPLGFVLLREGENPTLELVTLDENDSRRGEIWNIADAAILPSHPDDWKLDGGPVSSKSGELILDGRNDLARAFYLPLEWPGDLKLSAEFMVEPQDSGVLACGWIIGAKDSSDYYYVHFDRGQAILCRSTVDKSWEEIKRVSNLDKPAGAWHSASFERRGEKLIVSLNGAELFSADAPAQGGRIGFYASEGLAHVRRIVVSGARQKCTQPFVDPPKPFVRVCSNGGAGGYEAFPDVCRLADGRLFCVFYDGYTHVSLPNEKYPNGGRISGCFSSDEGHSWSKPFVVIDTPADDRDPSAVQLADGRILCNYFTYEPVEGESPRCATRIAESSDGGKTWTEPRTVYPGVPCSSPIRVLSDGRLILPTYIENNSEHCGSLGISDDGGKTWSKTIIIPNGGMRLDAETDVIERKDGSLYALEREKMAFSISTDRGETWSVSEPVGFPGHCPYFLRHSSGTIFVAFRVPNTSMRFSRDDCATWSENILVDEVIGAYPSMVELKDGSILIIYYEEGSGSNVRARRFSINDDLTVCWELL